MLRDHKMLEYATLTKRFEYKGVMPAGRHGAARLFDPALLNLLVDHPVQPAANAVEGFFLERLPGV